MMHILLLQQYQQEWQRDRDEMRYDCRRWLRKDGDIDRHEKDGYAVPKRHVQGNSANHRYGTHHRCYGTRCRHESTREPVYLRNGTRPSGNARTAEPQILSNCLISIVIPKHP